MKKLLILFFSSLAFLPSFVSACGIDDYSKHIGIQSNGFQFSDFGLLSGAISILIVIYLALGIMLSIKKSKERK